MALTYKKPSQWSVATIAAVKLILGFASKQDVLAEGAFADGDKTKLDTIEEGAQKNIAETDPVFTVSEAANFEAGDKDKLDSIEEGAQVNVAETDPVFSISPAASLTENDITKLNNLSGTNTGDQDLSGYALKTTQISGTLLSTEWVLNGTSGLYEYDFSNQDITATTEVDIIPVPANADELSVLMTSKILPYTESSAGNVKIKAVMLPTDDLTINILLRWQ